MTHHDLDKEIAHLEYVFGIISGTDRIPLSYWRTRLASLPASSLIPTQRSRLARLEVTLRAIEAAAGTALDAAPLRQANSRC